MTGQDLASFPDSHAPEHEHWSCAGVETLVFFSHVRSRKERREVDATLIVHGRMRLRTEKWTKVTGNLLHVSTYRVSNIIHTEHWSIVGWTTRKTLPFCFGPILITSCLHRKDTRLSPQYIFAFRESLGTRLVKTVNDMTILSVVYSLYCFLISICSLLLFNSSCKPFLICYYSEVADIQSNTKLF